MIQIEFKYALPAGWGPHAYFNEINQSLSQSQSLSNVINDSDPSQISITQSKNQMLDIEPDLEINSQQREW